MPILACTHPRNDDSCDGDFNARVFEQLVAKVDPVPEADDVTLDGNVVLPVEPERYDNQ